MDSSTIDPSVAQTVAQAAEKKGLRFIDGPVSGGRLHGYHPQDEYLNI